MLLVNESQELIIDGLRIGLAIAALIASCIPLHALFYPKQAMLSLRSSSVVGLLCFALLAGVIVYNQLSPFYRATVHDHALTLVSPSPYGKKELLWRDIETVKFGTNNRGLRSCYISVITHSGQRYRSIDLAKPIEHCKALRSQLLDIIEQ